ncbi:MAG: outer membrane beta-barrel protein [Bacteroidales bacterium]|nr:outer membrane beta-barrel protein [Bacteroidales bacterium]
MTISDITRKTLTGVIILSTISLSTIASNYIVRGVVSDTLTREPNPGTLIRVYAENDTVLPTYTTLTDSTGRFEQQIDMAGRYTLRAEFAGSKSKDVSFEVGDKNQTVQLDTINISENAETLEEFVISATKPLIENDGATLTYNMTEDPMAQGNSLLEMLRKVPMVTVDAEENIKVKGKSNFKIYLNGREDPMLSGDPKTILKSMPASTIKKVEVITEPGAKYEAEGTEGILNIVTITKQNLEGVVGNLSGWVNKGSAGASAYARTKVRNVTGSVNVSYNHSILPSWSEYTSSETLENLLSFTDRKRETEGRGSTNFSYTGGGFNLSWEPDTLNLFTAQGNIGYNKNRSWNHQTMRGLNADDEEQWTLRRNYTTLWKGLWASAGASYQHTFGKEGHYIVATYQYDFNKGDQSSLMNTNDITGLSELAPWRRNQGLDHTNMHTIQVDYVSPLGEHNILETGSKLVWRRVDNMSAPWYGATEESMTINQDESVSLAQFRNIQAVYVSHTGKYGKFGTKAGVRYEHTETGLDYYTKGYDSFSSTFNDIVPNAAFTFRFGGAQTLRLAYQMRISRPSVGQLNPYVNTMTVGDINYGNPNLDSERNNLVSLSYSNYGGKIGGSAQIGYSHTGNKIEFYTFSTGNLVNSTFGNIGKYENAFLSGDMQLTVIPNLTLSLYGYLSYEHYFSNTEMLKRKRNGWYWSYNVNADYRLPCKISISGYGGQGAKWFSLQQEGSGWYYYGLSVSRTFLKDDKLRVNIYGQSFFEPFRTYRNSSSGNGTFNSFSYRSPQWYAGVSVAWQFGKLNADVKRTGAIIESESEAKGSNTGR